MSAPEAALKPAGQADHDAAPALGAQAARFLARLDGVRPAPAARRRPMVMVRPSPSAGPMQYALRSVVRYRIDGQVLTGMIVGISHDAPLRYDIRRDQGVDGAPISFAVPHQDVEELLAPPAKSEKVIVLSGFRPEPASLRL